MEYLFTVFDAASVLTETPSRQVVVRIMGLYESSKRFERLERLKRFKPIHH
jgi:hypothetical protein